MTIESTPRTKKVTFLVTQETYDKLHMYSKAIDKSQGEILNELLQEEFEAVPDCLELGRMIVEEEEERRKRI